VRKRRHGDASFSQQLFDLPKAEAESMVEPNSVTNNLEGKTMTVVAGWLLFHNPQSAKPE
jgi:hypothetical protein